ncbi:DNA polymerase I [Mesomycoplasma conjunctivae]|uniref:5'-3' exonuclease n=1 Tax=Mesomycoplasma conjunctivae (strain ATCC 25834 / NCTC 10147 / HRC/581) TaxID=572263 RepID=C5J6X5_MESCH|nr:5'-3' exonuclease [Mesomycoplasma conjunctivae]CAT05238.1 5-3 exonuclease [Mesomycoplasma conjunctivae]VEU66459.1 DNA polymerase I [Mesomycoplasma conjunctivae]
MNRPILLIDGNLMLFKSYYGSVYGGGLLKNSQGIETNAIHTFFLTFFKLINLFNPINCYFAFDKGSKTPRHLAFSEYKQGRSETPESLFTQMEKVKQILTYANINWSQDYNYEADDLIASLKKQILDQNPQAKIVIFSADQDLLQLIDENTIVVDTIKAEGPNIKNLDNFYDLHHIFPHQVVDFKVLSGDKSDNIKIIAGLGLKGAQKLLEKYGNLENIIANSDQISGKIGLEIKEKKEKLLFFQNFITLYNTAKFNFNIFDNLDIQINDKLIATLEELELKTVLKNFLNFRK